MGYYTHYDISENDSDAIDAIIDQSGYGDVQEGGIKWYSCRDDMKVVSLMFPDRVLSVSGEGEESGDIWKAYYKDGKEQYERAQIVIGKYDESKLK